MGWLSDDRIVIVDSDLFGMNGDFRRKLTEPYVAFLGFRVSRGKLTVTCDRPIVSYPRFDRFPSVQELFLKGIISRKI